jgi:hypothetical protein
MDKIKIKKRIHNGYKEFQEVKKTIKDLSIREVFGKYQYIYSSKKGEISLVELKNYEFMTGKDMWEIYELSNNDLFEDIERFEDKTKAERRIKELLI